MKSVREVNRTLETAVSTVQAAEANNPKRPLPKRRASFLRANLGTDSQSGSLTVKSFVVKVATRTPSFLAYIVIARG